MCYGFDTRIITTRGVRPFVYLYDLQDISLKVVPLESDPIYKYRFQVLICIIENTIPTRPFLGDDCHPAIHYLMAIERCIV
jgi:hypothetical protein